MKKSLSFLLAVVMIITTFAGLSMITEAANLGTDGVIDLSTIYSYNEATRTHTWDYKIADADDTTAAWKSSTLAAADPGKTQYIQDLGGNLKMSTSGNANDWIRPKNGYITWAKNYTHNNTSYLEFTPEKSGALSFSHWVSGDRKIVIATSLPPAGCNSEPADALYYGNDKPVNVSLIGGTTYYIFEVDEVGNDGTNSINAPITYVESLTDITSTGIKWDFTTGAAWAWDTNYDGLTFTKNGWSWLPSACTETNKTWAVGAGGYITFTPAKDGILDFKYNRRVSGTSLCLSTTNGEYDESKILAKTLNGDGLLSAQLDPNYPADNLKLKAGTTYYIYSTADQFKYHWIEYTYLEDTTDPEPTIAPGPSATATPEPTVAPTPAPGEAEVTATGITWTFDAARVWEWGKDYNGLTLVKGTTGWNTLPTGSDDFVRIGKSAATSEADGGFIKFTPTKNGILDLDFIKEGSGGDSLLLNTTPFVFDTSSVLAYTADNLHRKMSESLAGGSLELEAGKTYYIYPKNDRMRFMWVTYTYLPDPTPIVPVMASIASFGEVESKFYLRFKTVIEKKKAGEFDKYGFYFINFEIGSENDLEATQKPAEMPAINVIEAEGDLNSRDSFSTDIEVTGTTATNTAFYAVPFVREKDTGEVYWGAPVFYEGDISNQ